MEFQFLEKPFLDPLIKIAILQTNLDITIKKNAYPKKTEKKWHRVRI